MNSVTIVRDLPDGKMTLIVETTDPLSSTSIAWLGLVAQAMKDYEDAVRKVVGEGTVSE